MSGKRYDVEIPVLAYKGTKVVKYIVIMAEELTYSS